MLRTWRAMCPALQDRWPEAARPEDWAGVTIENGRVVELDLVDFGLTGAVPAEVGRLSALEELDLNDNQLTSLPAEIGQLTLLETLNLRGNQLTSVPAEIGQLTALLLLDLEENQLTSLPAEIGQLGSLLSLTLEGNQLTSLPAEIGQLASLESLTLDHNQLTSLPAEIGQLASLKHLYLGDNQLTSVPAAIRELRAAGCEVSLDDDVTADSRDDARVLRTWRAMCPALQESWPEDEQPEDWEGVTIENGRVVELELEDFGLTGAVPAEIGRLSALRELNLGVNQLTSVPAEIGQLTSLEVLDPQRQQLTSVPAAIRELRAAGCELCLNDGVTFDE